MKKRPSKWIAFDVNTNNALKLKENNVSKSVTPTKTTPSITNKTKIDYNLIERLKPKAVADLAVHPKKIKEVSDWLQLSVITKTNRNPPILILSGPTGVGKTATINVLCKSLNINICEWVNPIDQDTDRQYQQAQSLRFLDFFNQAKYNSLCDNSEHKKIAVVEDFPNFVINNPVEFTEVLEKCLCGQLPVVFICTDASNSKIDLMHTLFPQEIRDRYHIPTINFNPVSVTLIKTALKRAQDFVRKQSEIFRIPSTEVTDAINVSAMGDVRSAMNQFIFACLKGVSNIPMEVNASIGKKRKRIGKTATIKSMERDETLGFFHALGRVLNPKHDESMVVSKLQYDFDSLIDQFSTQPSNFNAFLQENYLKYFGDLDDIREASDILSTAQLFLVNWSERHEIMLYSLWVSVLGLMIYNRHKVSKWNQIKGPTKLKNLSSKSMDDFELRKADGFYYNIIMNSDKFHVFRS